LDKYLQDNNLSNKFIKDMFSKDNPEHKGKLYSYNAEINCIAPVDLSECLGALKTYAKGKKEKIEENLVC